jgi:hypothetical protein
VRGKGGAVELNPDKEPDYAARVMADAEIVELLRCEGFTGTAFKDWQSRLIRDTTPRLTAGIRSRKAFHDKRTGRYVQPQLWHLRVLIDHDEASSLAGLTVALTLDRFRRDALIGRGWDLRRGVTINEYFLVLFFKA